MVSIPFRPPLPCAVDIMVQELIVVLIIKSIQATSQLKVNQERLSRNKPAPKIL